MSNEREFDVVVFGASGFTGRLVVEYLSGRAPAEGALRWAAAGRDREKLERVLAEVVPDPGRVPVIVADSHDRASLEALARRTRVVLTTVGPYARHGDELVGACVENGTSYCDLSGEVPWMRRMIDRHRTGAERSGARIVHACGFDSVPSDLGVRFLQHEAVRRFGRPCHEVALLVRAMRGGFSGGTAASLLNVIEEASADRDVARILRDPYSLNPEGMREGPDGRDSTGVGYNRELDVWTAPFVMASINTRVVRRTHALLDHAYGRDFRYSEATMTGGGLGGRIRALAMTAAMGAFFAAASNGFTRRHLVRRLLPDPGKGPDADARERGYFNLVLVGTTDSDERVSVRVTGDRDPGYGSTSKMIAECALCLARDEPEVGGGFWTPASCMGDRLTTRLETHAGVKFEVLPDR